MNFRDPIGVLIERKIEDHHKYIDRKDGRAYLVDKLGDLLCEEAELLIRRSGQLKPPFKPLKVRRGNTKFELRMNSNRAAHIPTKEGFRIEIAHKDVTDLSDLSTRARTTIAHEVAHTFFYDISEHPPKPIGVVSSKKSQWEIEHICYRIGRALLMPSFSISHLLSNSPNMKNASLRKMGWLKNLFKVSFHIVAWRMIKDLKLWNSCFVESKARTDGDKVRFHRMPIPLKNSDVRELDRIKLNRAIDKRHRIYPHLLRASKKEKGIVKDRMCIDHVNFDLESRLTKGGTIVTLITVKEPHSSQRQMTLVSSTHE